MAPILIALLLGTQQAPGQRRPPNPQVPTPVEVANRRFRGFVGAQKSMSVRLTYHRKGVETDGTGELILVNPDKLYFHFSWGKDDYTYAVSNGRAVEVDRGARLYDEYPVPYLGAPEANGSYWITSFFPAVFVDPNISLPIKSINAEGRATHYTMPVGNPPVGVNIKFSDYKTDISVPDSKFQLSPPAGFVAYSTQRLPPTLKIGEKLPNLQLASEGADAPVSLAESLDGKRTLVAVFGPDSEPGVASIPTLASLKEIRVQIVSLSSNGKALEAGGIPLLYDPQGRAGSALRAFRTPTYYLVDGAGKVTHVWYGFDRASPQSFISRVRDALAEQ